MRIICPIKQVPETNAVRMDEITGTMIREGVESIVNPLDLHAIEMAVRLREEIGGNVTALSMGPSSAVRALREAIALGCDSAVLVSGKAFAGSDTRATGYALASAIRRIGHFHMIVCGERATDGDTGQVGPAIAAFLGLAVVTYVSKIVEAGDEQVVVHRLVEDGYEVLEVALPAVLTVVKEIADPRLPTLHGKRKARVAEIPVWSATDLGVKSEDVGLKGSPTRVVRVFRPRIARECTKILASDEQSIQDAVCRLIDLLQEKQLI